MRTNYKNLVISSFVMSVPFMSLGLTIFIKLKKPPVTKLLFGCYLLLVENECWLVHSKCFLDFFLVFVCLSPVKVHNIQHEIKCVHLMEMTCTLTWFSPCSLNIQGRDLIKKSKGLNWWLQMTTKKWHCILPKLLLLLFLNAVMGFLQLTKASQKKYSTSSF